VESHVPLSIEQDHPSARIRASGLPSPNARRLARPRKGIWEKALRQMRQKAKRIVAEHVQRRRKELGPHAFTRKPELRKYAGFSADEVEIEADAGEQRILDVLGTIGRGDEFEPIREAAYKEYQPYPSRHRSGWIPLRTGRPRKLHWRQTWRKYASSGKPQNQRRSGKI
jgi:hypothetical protein